MILILVTFLFQLNNPLNGQWEQITQGEDKGVKDIIEFKKDSIRFIQEFFSENSYKIEGDILKVVNSRNEEIIESKLKIIEDTLFLFKGNRIDRMIRISPPQKSNEIIGTWTGKTNKGVQTYFVFKNNTQVVYKAVINEKKFKYESNKAFILIYIGKEPEKINYIIRDDRLALIYPDTKEKFEYKRINYF